MAVVPLSEEELCDITPPNASVQPVFVKKEGSSTPKSSEAKSTKLDEQIEKWELMDEAAQGKIGERVHSRYKIKSRDSDTAKEMLDRILLIYENNKVSAIDPTL